MYTNYLDMFANTWLLCASLTKPDTRLYYVNYELQTHKMSQPRLSRDFELHHVFGN